MGTKDRTMQGIGDSITSARISRASHLGYCLQVAFEGAVGHDATVTCLAGSADGDLVLTGTLRRLIIQMRS